MSAGHTVSTEMPRDSNCFCVEEHIAARQEDVFAVLRDVQGMISSYSPGTTSVRVLTPGPIGLGTRMTVTSRYLFLREVLSLEVTACDSPSTWGVNLDDGYNQINYLFQLREEGPGQTAVRCTVHCYTCSGVAYPGPSEKLARMMEKQEGPLLQRLKGYVEGSSCPVY